MDVDFGRCGRRCVHVKLLKDLELPPLRSISGARWRVAVMLQFLGQAAGGVEAFACADISGITGTLNDFTTSWHRRGLQSTLAHAGAGKEDA
eukprot:6180773-Pleurochrysis_carterae.AAC.3